MTHHRSNWVYIYNSTCALTYICISVYACKDTSKLWLRAGSLHWTFMVPTNPKSSRPTWSAGYCLALPDSSWLVFSNTKIVPPNEMIITAAARFPHARGAKNQRFSLLCRSLRKLCQSTLQQGGTKTCCLIFPAKNLDSQNWFVDVYGITCWLKSIHPRYYVAG